MQELRTIISYLKNPRQLHHFLFDNQGTLKQKIVKSCFWVFAMRISKRLLEFLRTIILARILAPDDFGLMAIALLALATLERFSQTGVQQALIQIKSNVKDYFDTAWIIQIFRGILISLVLFFGAPLISDFFSEPKAVNLIRAVAFSELLKSFINIRVIFFQKKLEFNKQFLFETLGTITDLIVSVILALVLKNSWAMVYGLLAGNFIRLIFSHLLFETRFPTQFDRNKMLPLLKFGKYLFFQSFILFLITQGDDAVVGRYISAAALGIYSLAYKLSNIGATEISHVISSVTFPAFSQIQDNEKKLKKGISSTLELVTLFSIPMSLYLVFFTEPIVELILGKQWLNAVSVIKVLSIFGLTRSIGSSFGPVYRAINKLHVPLRINIITLIIQYALILPWIGQLELMKISIAVTIAGFVGMGLTSICIARMLDLNLVTITKNIIIKILIFCFYAYIIHYLTQFFAYNTLVTIILSTFSLLLYSVTILLIKYKEINF